ncbi:hypothetical protein Scep_002121 [Stephania cephalantha]|uniref:DUF4216 domain-containing protein n=1 Tax=Stephania cephalantha TaxID=152367 RepID=A0AAP0Q4D7_9MAGN
MMEEDLSENLRWLAEGPRDQALSYNGFVINGYRFHIQDIERTRQNSGVSIEATDPTRTNGEVTYYGVLKKILLLNYNIRQIPVFKCHRMNDVSGKKVVDEFTLVKLDEGQHQYENDPLILAIQAKQVFYSKESEDSHWHVVLRAPPRGVYEEDINDEKTEIYFAPLDVTELDAQNVYDDVPYTRDEVEGISCEKNFCI